MTMTSNVGAIEKLMTDTQVIEMLGLQDRPNPKSSLKWLMRIGKLAYVRWDVACTGSSPRTLKHSSPPAGSLPRRPPLTDRKKVTHDDKDANGGLDRPPQRKRGWSYRVRWINPRTGKWESEACGHDQAYARMRKDQIRQELRDGLSGKLPSTTLDEMAEKLDVLMAGKSPTTPSKVPSTASSCSASYAK